MYKLIERERVRRGCFMEASGHTVVWPSPALSPHWRKPLQRRDAAADLGLSSAAARPALHSASPHPSSRHRALEEHKGVYAACRQAEFAVKNSSGLATCQSHAVSWCRTEERPLHSWVSSAPENLTLGQGSGPEAVGLSVKQAPGPRTRAVWMQLLHLCLRSVHRVITVTLKKSSAAYCWSQSMRSYWLRITACCLPEDCWLLRYDRRRLWLCGCHDNPNTLTAPSGGEALLLFGPKSPLLTCEKNTKPQQKKHWCHCNIKQSRLWPTSNKLW